MPSVRWSSRDRRLPPRRCPAAPRSGEARRAARAARRGRRPRRSRPRPRRAQRSVTASRTAPSVRERRRAESSRTSHVAVARPRSRTRRRRRGRPVAGSAGEDGGDPFVRPARRGCGGPRCARARPPAPRRATIGLDVRPPARALELFAPLAPTYDRVGAVLSFGQDPRWRRFLVSRLPGDGGRVLDVATGTGLVAERAARARLPGHRARPEPGDAGRARGRLVRRQRRPRRGVGRGAAVRRGGVRPPDVHVPAPLRRRSGGDAARARAGRPAGRDGRGARVRRASRPLAASVGGVGARGASRSPALLLRSGLVRGRPFPRRVDPRLLERVPARAPARALAGSRARTTSGRGGSRSAAASSIWGRRA